jgi:hypothetical protein
MAEDWSEREVRVAVDAYLDMLARELQGQAYRKSQIRAEVLPRLDGRSAGSLEFKNCNISAALIEMGFPSINGYKPRWNFQRAVLPRVLVQALLDRPGLADLIHREATTSRPAPAIPDLLGILDPCPPEMESARYKMVGEPVRAPAGRFPNYFEIEARNRSIGLGGEELVLAFERERLLRAGKDKLAGRIEHVSLEHGDGVGFDIRSFEPDGRDLFIEVKTTRFARESPFFISANEVSFGRERSEAYALYRVYRFHHSPRLFTLHGDPSKHCRLTPTHFRASFNCA